MPLVIPTYFTAVNGISPTMVKIGADMNKLGARAAAAQAQMNGFLPSFGGIGRSIGHMLPSLAATGVIAAAALSGKAIADYRTEISNLSAVTGATGDQLALFEKKIKEVATDKSIQKSVVEVAKAFTTVDNNMPELHKLPEDLAEVTKATILLAKASRMELAPSAEAMTMSMHQFNLTAKDATHVIDVMAAGAVYGSSRIAETSEALQKFGAAAKNVLNVSYEESVGLIELASRFEKGSEAGTRLRNILLTMGTIKAKPDLANELARIGVNVETVTDKSKPLIQRLTELSKVKTNTILMEKLFDKRNVTMASGVFSRIDKFQGILDGLKTEGLAAQMAETNTDNLTGSLQKLAAKWVTIISTSSQTNVGVNLLSGSLNILTNNLEWITTVTVLAAEAFFGWKAVLWLTTKATYAYEFALGMLATVNSTVNQGVMVTTASLNGFNLATRLASVGVWGLVGYAGLAVAAFGLLASMYEHNTRAAASMNTELDETGNKLTDIHKNTTQAQIGLQRYQQALKDYNDYQQEIANAEYDKKHGIRNFGNLFGLYHPDQQAVQTIKPDINSYVNPGDYKKSTKDGHDVIELKKETGKSDNDETVAVLKDIRTLLRPGSGGGRMPRTTQTGGYA